MQTTNVKEVPVIGNKPVTKGAQNITSNGEQVAGTSNMAPHEHGLKQDNRISVSLSVALTAIFGIAVVAIAGRVFLNALDMREIKTLLTSSISVQSDFRRDANIRFGALELEWKREADLMRGEIARFETHINTMWFRMRRAEDKLGITSNSDEYQQAP